MYKLILDEVVETTTSTPISVRNLRDLSIQVICSDCNLGNGVFEVEGSNDGVNYKALMTISNLANAKTEWLTRVVSLTLNADGNDFMFLDDFIGVKYIRVVLTFTADGKYSAIIFGNKIAT